MKLKLFDGSGKSTGDRELPKQFNETVRHDIIKRAVVAINANNRQPYGASPYAGFRASAELSRRRRAYRGGYGKGISRVPRKITSRRGSQMGMVGAINPNTVGGHRAHPPKAIRNWNQKVNTKERKKAIRSALAATLDVELVKKRSHILPNTYPFILTKSENLSKLKEIKSLLETLGFNDELNRINSSKVRAGKGKLRSRKHKTSRGMLFVTSKYCSLSKAARNIPGVDIKSVRTLNAEDLAPGTHPGRLTIFTEEALNEMSKLNLFM